MQRFTIPRDVYHGEGALAALASGRAERLKRVRALVAHLDDSDDGRRQLREHLTEVLTPFGTPDAPPPAALTDGLAADGSYLDAIRALGPDARAAGTAWLQGIIDGRLEHAAALLPALDLGA